jgi:hypothetical protein
LKQKEFSSDSALVSWPTKVDPFFSRYSDFTLDLLSPNSYNDIDINKKEIALVYGPTIMTISAEKKN